MVRTIALFVLVACVVVTYAKPGRHGAGHGEGGSSSAGEETGSADLAGGSGHRQPKKGCEKIKEKVAEMDSAQGQRKRLLHRLRGEGDEVQVDADTVEECVDEIKDACRSEARRDLEKIGEFQGDCDAIAEMCKAEMSEDFTEETKRSVEDCLGYMEAGMQEGGDGHMGSEDVDMDTPDVEESGPINGGSEPSGMGGDPAELLRELKLLKSILA